MALIKCNECGAEISKSAKSCPHCGVPAKKKTSIVTWVVTIFLTFMFISLMVSPKTESSKIVNNKSPKEQAIENIDFDFSWTTEGFGNIMEANFTIQNKGIYDVKDIEVECIHTAKSGTKIDANSRVIYEIFKHKSTKKIRKFNMGFIHSQTNKTYCHIKDLVVIEQ